MFENHEVRHNLAYAMMAAAYFGGCAGTDKLVVGLIVGLCHLVLAA